MVRYTKVMPSFSQIEQVVPAPTQPQLNSKVGSDTKKTLHHPPTTTTTQTQCQQYLRCSCADFNQALKVGLWDQQQQ